MNAIGKLAIPGLRGVWRDDAEFNAILRALCVPHENGVREQTKRKASVEVAMQPFSVARWALWKGGGGQLPHGVWVPFGAARSNEHRHTRARKSRHDRSETHPQEQRGEGFAQRESWGGRLDVDKTSAPPQKFFRRCGPRCSHRRSERAVPQGARTTKPRSETSGGPVSLDVQRCTATTQLG